MSTTCLEMALEDDVLVLRLANPPSNALSPDLRAALLTAITHPPAHSVGIVLCGQGASFSRGLPDEPDSARPDLSDLCFAVAGSEIPVVAALHGLVMGQGAELALAAHARIAGADLRLAFPDVAFGLCSAGGTTQRLPHLVGPGAALQLLLSGRAVSANEALALGLIDAESPGALAAAAVRMVRALAGGKGPERRVPPRAGWQEAIKAARGLQAARQPAGQRIVDCVEAALLLPVEAGLAFEAVAREDLEQSPEAAALRSAYRAERQAAIRPAAVARTRPLPVDNLGLYGTDAALVSLAVRARMHGVGVVWQVPDGSWAKRLESAVSEGIWQSTGGADPAAPSARSGAGRLEISVDPAELHVAALQIHASPPPAALPDRLRVILGGAEGEMGLALAPQGVVCELSLVPDCPPLALATALEGLKRIGLKPVLVGRQPVLGSRLMAASAAAVNWMVAGGLPWRLVATALEGFGMSVADPPFAKDASAIGTNMAGPQVPRLRESTPEEVVNRWLAALANTGFRLLAEGIARQVSDIDHLLVAGHGFPRWRGGPMHLAESRGLMLLRRDLRLWAQDHTVWQPTPALDDRIGHGLAEARPVSAA